MLLLVIFFFFFLLSLDFSICFSFLLFICRHTPIALLFFVVLSELSDREFLDFSIDVSGVMSFKRFLFSSSLFFLLAGFPVYKYFEWRIWLRPAIVLSFCFSFYHSSYQRPSLILLTVVKQLEVVDLHQLLLKHLKPLHLAIWWCRCFLEHYREWDSFLLSIGAAGIPMSILPTWEAVSTPACHCH